MNKQELISKIKKLEGVTQDERAYLINLVNTKKKYGLVWEDKPEDVEEQLRENLPVLKEVKEKAIINGEEHPNHILIEGDNLHALTALTFTHEGKIDVIYIDPPYNTGNKDFKYNDTFVDKEDSFRHSKWLSFMYKRLKIAKKLLHENGIVYISIDDNEQSQLKLLCDEIFIENNFVGTFIWVKKKKGSHLSKTLRSMTEYVLCYSKSIKNIELYGEEAYADKWQPLVKRTNSLKNLVFPENFLQTTLKNGKYLAGKYGNGTSSIKIKNDFNIEEGIILESITVEASFVWVQKKLNEEIKLGSAISLSSKFGFNTLRHNQSDKIKRPSSLINPEIGVGTNEDAYQELINIFNAEGVMTYPKPSTLISYLINTLTFYSKNESPIILDFFAGTGTSLHSTMALNAEDGGNRQCILVTNNENNICEEVTYERNKRVIEGYNNAKGAAVEGLKNNNLRYFKSEYVSRDQSMKNKKELAKLATELLCIKEDCYHELHSKVKWYRAFSGQKSQFIIIYEDMKIEDSFEIIKKLFDEKKNDNPVKVYVFSNGQYPYTEDFEEVLALITLCALPDAIYKAYQNVLPNKKRTTVPDLEEDAIDEEGYLFNQETV
ncbi:adenine-specific DNA-methyltransferase [Flavobacterium sp. CG_23.5]|uniref:site-specific DNA-methyltransferase n=1 Tax=Flavobacterium sp. CG_23.5 TaxID=2760708 RepID=UPI001AEA1CF6|nr:site-specific DNA-methyltransferase [Flavobacterium sp. CG_23.5]MBP2281733.1 adenine-specific DNA-methyltransferase [Flavobacterium sp. CG_23.5]